MPSAKRPADRRWSHFFVDHASRDLQTGSRDMTPEVALKRVQEEFPGQREALRGALLAARGIKTGSVVKGRRFLLVCTG